MGVRARQRALRARQFATEGRHRRLSSLQSTPIHTAKTSQESPRGRRRICEKRHDPGYVAAGFEKTFGMRPKDASCEFTAPPPPIPSTKRLRAKTSAGEMIIVPPTPTSIPSAKKLRTKSADT